MTGAAVCTPTIRREAMDPIAAMLTLVPAAIFLSIFWTELKGAGWQPAPKRAIERALELANVRPGDVFYDLGAGDGRVVLAAAKAGARAVGVEIDPIRFLLCKVRLKVGGGNVRILLSDLFSARIDDASVVFVYLRDWSTERLKDKLMAELRPGTRVITYYWPLKGWKPVAEDKENDIYVYRIK